MSGDDSILGQAERIYEEALRSGAMTTERLLELAQAHPDLAVLLRQLHALRGLADRRIDLLDEVVVPGYRIRSILGEGGMGIVYEAADLVRARRVALKIVRPELAQKPAIRQRFLREARAMTKVRSPYSVAIYEVVESPALLAIAMELVDGESLDDVVHSLRSRVSREELVRRVLGYGREIAIALSTLHANGLVHRDVKPSNILVRREDGVAMLADFGLVRDIESDDGLTSGFLGTPAFAAPEQRAVDGKADARTDLYALGLTLLAAIEEAVLTTESAVSARELPIGDRIRGVLLHSPGGTGELLTVALESDPRDRYPSGRALADDLERLLLGQRPRVRPRGRLRVAWHSVVRSKARSAAAIAIVLAAVGLSTLALQWPRIEAARSEERERELAGREQTAFLRLVNPMERAMAIAEFDEVLATDSTRRDALLGAICGRVLTGDVDAARAIVDRHSGVSVEIPEVLALLDPREARVAERAAERPETGDSPVRVRYRATAAYFTALLTDRKVDHEHATELLHQLIFVEPGASVQHRGMLAYSAGRAGRDDMRRSALTALRTNWPDSPYALAWIAICLEREDPLAAADAVKRAIDRAPEMERWLVGILVSAAARSGDRETAVARIEAAKAKRPADAEPWLWEASLLEVARDFAAAAASAREAAARAPMAAEVWGYLGRLYYRAREFAESAAALRKTCAMRPTDWESTAILGEALQKSGANAEALEVLAIADERLPTSPRPAYHMSAAAYSLGDLDGAIRHVERCLQRLDAGGEGITRESAEKAHARLLAIKSRRR
ncbi:MAG: protein kinase [Planctomycetota bacterium]